MRACCCSGSQSRCFLDKLRKDIQKGAVSHIRSVGSPPRRRRPEGVRGSKLCGRELDSCSRGHRAWFFIVLESVALRGTKEQDERDRGREIHGPAGYDSFPRLELGRSGWMAYVMNCTWTFYPAQMYLNVHCVSCYHRAVHKIVEVESSPLPPQHAKRAKVGSRFRGRERERVQESASVPTSFHLDPFTCSLSMDINITTNHLNRTCSF